MTRPARSLTISFARTDDEGAALPPSQLLGELQQRWPRLHSTEPPNDLPPVTLAETQRWRHLIRVEQPQSVLAASYAALQAALADDPRHAAALQRLARGAAYRNEPAPLGNFRRPRTDGGAGDKRRPVWITSPSELETYLQCPFRHFAQYGVRLEEASGPAAVALDLGSLAHELLADVTRAAIESGAPVAEIADVTWEAWLDEAAERQAGARGPEFEMHQPRRAFLGDRQIALLREVVLAHADRWRRGHFEPRLVEHGLGDDPDGPPIDFDHSAGPIRLRGQVDRVDAMQRENGVWLLLYDYKSTPSSLAAPFLTGDRLQLMLYAIALQRGQQAATPAHIAGLLLAPLRPGVNVLDKKYAADVDPSIERMFLYRPRGLVAREIAFDLDRDLTERASPVANMGLKKGGDFSGTYRDAVPAAEIVARLELAERTLHFAADGVTAGCIDVAPLVEAQQLACGTCPYQSLCRFERGVNRPRAAETALPQLGGKR